MKLVKCYVSSFGNLQDFTYDFNEGLNTIKQDNGWGKTTLATFIKVMFYGLDGNGKKSLTENERKKYRPWNSTEMFGGYVQFIRGGVEYKLQRYFGKKESDDTITLTDVKTGKNFANTENLGKRIFEIDAEGFSLTTYFAQKDLESKSNTSLTEKFNKNAQIDDSASFDKALSSVTDKVKKYKYSGDRGFIPDAKRELFALNEQMEKVNRATNTIAVLKGEEKQLEGEVVSLRAQTEELTSQVSIVGKAEANTIKRVRYLKLCEEQNFVKEQLNSANEILKEKAIIKEQIEEKERKLFALESLIEQQKTLKNEISELEKQTGNAKESKQSILPIILIFMAVLLGAVGGAMLFILGVQSVLAWAFILVALLSVLSIFIVKNKPNRAQEVSDPIINICAQKRVQFLANQEKIDQIKGEILQFLALFNLPENISAGEAVRLIYRATEKRLDSEQKLAKITAELNELEPFKAEFSLEGGAQISLNELNAKLRLLQTQYTTKSNELAYKRSTITSYENLASTYTELEDKKADILEKIDRYEKELETYNLVAEYLKKADENLKVRYRQPLQDSLNKYVSIMTDGKYSVNIDVDLNVTVNEKGGDKETEFFSKGYQNLFEICKRFALIDILFTGEKPFIIIDDSFYNLDEKKLELALDLIKKLSKEYQIIYLVCHQSREAK